MIFNRIHQNDGALEIVQACCHVSMEVIADDVGEKWLPVFGAKDEVDVNFCERLGHRMGNR